MRLPFSGCSITTQVWFERHGRLFSLEVEDLSTGETYEGWAAWRWLWRRKP